MKAKKGISLIVLVITIIVIIILAAAVLLSLSKNNPMDSARVATYQNDMAEVRAAVALYISNFVGKDYYHNGPFSPTNESVQIGINSGKDVEDNKLEPVKESVGTQTNATPTYAEKVSWNELGLTGSSKPTSIYSCTYNMTNGEFTFEPAAGYKAQ